MRIVTLQEMRNIERRLFQSGQVSETTIIEKVGQAVSAFLTSIYDGESEIIILIGKGNNGADGVAAGLELIKKKIKVELLDIFPDEKGSGELSKQKKRLKGRRIIPVHEARDLEHFLLNKKKKLLVVDAILGTGVRFPISDRLKEIFELVNVHADFLIALDIPSGINGDTGALDESAIEADYTLAVELPKLGFYLDQGPKHTGRVEILSVGFPTEFVQGGDTFLLEDHLLSMLPPRSPFSHKNSFGHLLIIGGSSGMTGAVKLAAKAALKVGVGLVTCMTWEDSYLEMLVGMPPEVMSKKIDSNLDFQRYSAILIGPGLGISGPARELVLAVMRKYQGPLLIDADAINNLNLADLDHLSDNSATILTPHLGEMSRLIACDKDELSRTPIEIVKRFKFKQLFLLKSFISYLFSADGRVDIYAAPNDALAKAGSGDILSGMMGGFCGQISADNLDLSIYSAIIGHALAGRVAAEKYGGRSTAASEILEMIPSVFLKGLDNETD